jgi:hypothetical protein
LPDLVIEAVVAIKTTFVQRNFGILTGERLSGRSPKSLRQVLEATLH